MSVTIKDVAKCAGVSNGTVSRVFNGYSDVSDTVRERIFSIANDMGYSPNVNARRLSAKSSKDMGLIMSGFLDSNRKDNISFQIMCGAYKYAGKENIEMTLYAIDTVAQQKKSYVKFCADHRLAGAVLSGIATDEPYFRELLDTKIPCVVVDVETHGKSVGWVSVDNFQASKDMTQLLLNAGHTRIVFVCGKENAYVTHQRKNGSVAACLERGITIPSDRILYCDFNEQTAYNNITTYIRNFGQRACTAFCVQSDIMAFGVINAIKDSGFRVPDDFSVVGFDGIPLSEYTSPPLTTVFQNQENIGFAAAELLHKIILGDCANNQTTIPYSIFSRDSVKTL